MKTRHTALLLDTGAARSVVGLSTARRIARQTTDSHAYGSSLRLNPSKRRFRFGEDVQNSLGSMQLRFATPGGIMTIVADVVQANVPFLLGLDALDEKRLQILSVRNLLEHVPVDEDSLSPKSVGWTLPTFRSNGHIYVRIEPLPPEHAVFYSRRQLHALHRNLFHPSPTKLYELLRRANPEDLDPSTLKVLQEISRACEACQRFSPAPMRFKVTIPGEAVFYRRVKLDLMFESGRAILHVVDEGTNLNAAAFLKGQDVGSVWNAFTTIWGRTYLGEPEQMLCDQGSVFSAKEWKQQCSNHDIDLQFTPVEQHNALGAGETYHEPLRRVFRKLVFEHPKVDHDVLLQVAVYAVNTSANPHGLVPCLLVFGALPRVPFLSATNPKSTNERMVALEVARDEYARIIAQRRVQLGLSSHAPAAVDTEYYAGDRVFVWRETPKAWTGPYKVVRVEGKTVFVQMEASRVAQFSVTRCKHAVLPEINWTEVLSGTDPRANSEQMQQAVKDEIVGLIRRGTFRLVVLPEERGKENILPTKLVLAIKHVDGKDIYKARLCLGGHRDRERGRQVHYATTLSQTSIRILLAISSILGFDIWTEDVVQAFLQSAERLKRKIFIRPDILELGRNEFLELILPLYGLTEAGDYWSKTLTDFCIGEAQFQQSDGDLNLFFRKIRHELVGMAGSYVDDLILAAPREHRDELKEIFRKHFECKPSENSGDENEFVGMKIRQTAEGIQLAMAHYLKRLRPIALDASFKSCAGLRASLLWVAHCRPDVAAFCSIAGSIVENDFSRIDIEDINSTLGMLQDSPDICLRFPPLDRSTLRIVAYCDAGFANRRDRVGSQLGYVITLVDGTGRFCILSFRSFKSQRVVRSAMAAETLSVTSCNDVAYVIKRQISAMLGKEVKLTILTDSKQVFDMISMNKRPSELRLMVDIQATRQAYQRHEVDNVGLIRSEHNIADSMTKLRCNKALVRAMRSGILNHPVVDYIVRR